MGEARRDSSSSLQHKKPPWLKLDIPAVVPPAAEEPSFLQVGPGQRGLRVLPVQCPHRDPVAQPLRRQAFLRSVSMPAEPARVPSPHQEPRRPALQRQMSITQTIRRYWAVLAAWGGWGPGAEAGSLRAAGLGAGQGPSRSCIPAPLLWGWLPLPAPFSAPSTSSLLSVSPPNVLAPDSHRVRSGHIHTLPPLGPQLPAGPSRSARLSRSLLRYRGQGRRVLASASVSMACVPLELPALLVSPGLLTAGAAAFLLACPRAVGSLPGAMAPASWVLPCARPSCCSWPRSGWLKSDLCLASVSLQKSLPQGW